MRIAILEDDPGQAEFVQQTLTLAGYICKTFSKGQELITQLRRETFDLLVLDWVLPDISGEEVLKWVRENLADPVPILFITNRRRDSDVITILSAGADDYLIKPVSAGVLLARVQTLLRRMSRLDPPGKAVFYEYEFDLHLKQVAISGHPISTTQKEFETALLLFRNLGRPISRAHILDVVWKQASDTPSRTIDTHVSSVRIKLRLRAELGYSLMPIYGYGYRLDRLLPKRDG
jgi:DNA-binding response OmpR family regulator